MAASATASAAPPSSQVHRPFVLVLVLFLVLLYDGLGLGQGVVLGDLDLGHGGGALERGRRGDSGVVGGRGRRRTEGLDEGDTGGGSGGVGLGWVGEQGVLDLALGVVAEGGAGVLEVHGIEGVGRREGVAGRDRLLHELLPLFASRHRLLVLDL